MDLMTKEFNADVNIKNNSGQTALHVAAEGDVPISLWYLVTTCGMDINDADNCGRTPLHWACVNQNQLIINYILALNP